MKNLLKKSISCILTFAIIFSLTVYAEAFVEICAHSISPDMFSEGIFDYSVIDDYVIIGGTNSETAKNIVIPEKINEIPVKEIARCAFEDNTVIETVFIPSSVEIINDDAFSGCSSLKNVTISEGVKHFGYRIFENCSSLESVKIPSTFEKKASSGYFRGCTSLKEITVPENILGIDCFDIEDTAFYNDEANWENGVLYLQHLLIDAKKEITGKYTVKEGTKKICWTAFNDCDKLTEVVIPEGVTELDYSVFAECDALETVHLPATLKIINNKSFYRCHSIRNIILPEGLEVIEFAAFGECSSLEKIVIPSSVTKIENSAFEYCRSLADVSFMAQNATMESDIFEYTAFINDASNWENNVLYLGTTLYAAKKDISGTYTIKPGTTKIADNAFSDCVNLEGVIFPDTLTEIGCNAFLFCTNLKNVALPDGLEKIGGSAFGNCKRFTSFTFPEKITEIGFDVLIKCSNLEEINIGKNVQNIIVSAFLACESLRNINIHSENQYYSAEGAVLFNADKTVLIKSYDKISEEYIVPSSVNEIGVGAFALKNLKSIKLHDNIAKIGADAFEFSGINIPENKPDGNLYIDNCLIHANNDEKYVVKEGTRLIADEAFAHYYLLKELYIPESVEYIGEHIVYSDINLEKVTVKSADAVIYRCAFRSSIEANTVIYGYADSTTAEHAKLYGLEFCSLGKAPEKVTETDEIRLFGENYLLVVPEISRTELFSNIKGTVNLVYENGTPVSDNALIASGMKIVSNNKSFEKTVIVIGDADEDGRLSAADARLALRASVELETLSALQRIAANADSSDEKISASDARIILRASVGLENMKEILSVL